MPSVGQLSSTAPVLRAGRVCADRGGVHEAGHAALRRRREHARTAVDVAPASSPRRGRAGSARRDARPRRPRRTRLEVVSRYVRFDPGGLRERPPACGARRPTTDCTARSPASERSTLVPTLPEAPVTTMRMSPPTPGWVRQTPSARPAGHSSTSSNSSRPSCTCATPIECDGAFRRSVGLPGLKI